MPTSKTSKIAKLKEKTKSKRGGKRPLSGAKKQYSEETTTVTFRVPKSKVSEIKELVNSKLKEYKI